MDSYIKIFIDAIYPDFLDKYLETDTLKRLKHVTQFCGCDYTKLYHPLFLYTRFDHSVVVAHMTWHFTHDKKQTIVALLHDIGTPCFAHCIDYVFGDYLKQESSEKSLVEMLKKEEKIIDFLKEDGLSLEDFQDFSNYPILENKSPRLCTDCLDGVLHTCYIWLHTHSLEQIKEVYENILVLKNEDNVSEIGFQNLDIAEKFVSMVHTYAKELQGNRNKFVMKYISEIVKAAFEKKRITWEDLYERKEEEICSIFSANFSSWKVFNQANHILETDAMPENVFSISVESKKRNTIPLVSRNSEAIRVDNISSYAKNMYFDFFSFKSPKYAYIKEIHDL